MASHMHVDPAHMLPSYLAQSQVGAIYAAVITGSVLMTIAVPLRFISRAVANAPLWWDDWAILVALIFGWGGTAIRIWETKDLGFGRHIETQLKTPWKLTDFSKASQATQLVYYVALISVKSSLLLFYYRIFGVNKRFRISAYIVAVICWATFFAIFLTSVFQCTPVRASWDHNIPNAYCIDLIPYAYGNGIANLLTDVLILVLPMPMVWGLTNVSRKRKFTLTGVFLLGAFVCAISIIRITTIKSFNEKDPQWGGVGLGVWSHLETCIGIVCACLPTIWPLFAYASGRLTSRKSKISSSSSSSTGGSGSDDFSNSAKLRSSDESNQGTDLPLNEYGVQGRDGNHHFARLDEDLELGEVKGKGWTVVKRASVGADLDG